MRNKAFLEMAEASLHKQQKMFYVHVESGNKERELFRNLGPVEVVEKSRHFGLQVSDVLV